jgi:hypothetical protein
LHIQKKGVDSMSEFKRVEVIRGSGNAFKDLGIANADVMY